MFADVLVYTNGILQWILSSLCCTARSVTYVDMPGMMLISPSLILVGLLFSECTAGAVSPPLLIFFSKIEFLMIFTDFSS